jgi:putative methionine-R-sulfoxide reductase with GAF domain
MRTVADSIVSVLTSAIGRVEKARGIAALIRELSDYRWVGIYDVGPEMVSIISYSGPGAPAYPQFPVTKGLTGSAIRDRKIVVVGDVRDDPRYLTAFGSTRSEIIIPVLDEKTGAVVGTIDVESEQVNAFSKEDQLVLKECARAARPLWWGGIRNAAASERIAEIHERARKRGRILLRCPHCRHYLVGILSARGDHKNKLGERSNLYCCWPDCSNYEARVKLRDAVRGQGPRDGSKCCARADR